MTPVAFDTAIEQLAALLNEAGIAHALIGGIAVGLHGYARSTGDIDLLVDGNHRMELIALLERAGYQLAASTEEALHFSGPVAVDVLLARRETSRRMLREAQPVPALHTRVLRVEDIIGLKIQAFSNNRKRIWHDQADIAELIRANPNLDWTRVQEYAAMFEATARLEEIRQTVLG